MFLEKIKKILFGQTKGQLSERLEKPSLYAPGKGEGKALEAPEKIVVTKEYLFSPTVKNLLLIGIFLIAILIIGIFIYRFARFDIKKVSLDIRGIERVAAGKPFGFKVVVGNANRHGFSDAILTISAPPELDYLKIIEGNIEKTRTGYKVLVGEIAGKSIKEVNFEAMAMAPKDTRLTLNLELNFIKPSSFKRSNITNAYTLLISEDPFDFSIAQGMPTFVYNQEAKFVVRYRNKTDVRISNAKIELFYPLNFQPYRYSRLPSSGNNIWNIVGLEKGAEGIIEIYGVFDFVENQKEAAIEGKVLSINARNEEIIVAKNILSFAIKEPPLLLSVSARKLIFVPGDEARSIFIPNEQEFKEIDGIRRNETILFRIKIKNTSSVIIEDVNLETLFDLDERQIDSSLSFYSFSRNINDPQLYKDPNFIDSRNRYVIKATDSGVFDAQNRRVWWNKFKYPALAILAPQETKETAVIIKIKNTIDILPINNLMKSLVSFKAFSDKVPFQLAGLRLEDKRTFALKTNTDFGLNYEQMHNSPYFVTQGPIPFQAQVKTTYVIGFKVYNTFNTLSNFELRGKLSSYFDYENKFYPASENVSFDPLTREIIWRVGKLLPGANYYTKGPMMYFQVAITPTSDLPFFYDNNRPEDVDIVQNKKYPPIPIFTNILAQANDDFLNKRLLISLPDIKIHTYIIK